MIRVEARVVIIVEPTGEEERAKAIVDGLAQRLGSPSTLLDFGEYHKFPDGWRAMLTLGPFNETPRSVVERLSADLMPNGWEIEDAETDVSAFWNRRDPPTMDPALSWIHVWAFLDADPNEEPFEAEELEIEHSPEELEELGQMLLEAFEALDAGRLKEPKPGEDLSP